MKLIDAERIRLIKKSGLHMHPYNDKKMDIKNHKI
jgi:hypothetical protein